MKPGGLAVINHCKAAEKEPKLLEHPGGCGCRVPTTDICNYLHRRLKLWKLQNSAKTLRLGSFVLLDTLP